MNEEYVTRNEFSEFMKRTEAMIIANREETKANIARIEAKEEASEARCQAQIAEIRGEVKVIRSEVREIRDAVNEIKSFRYNIMSWITAFCTMAITGITIYLAVRGN